ncbi:MAG: hypothetical protein M0Z44_00395 [Gammaproteobacteria bacterium]|nr:hypothetical protein [Gammaproteobacteria bacterium]
MRTLAGVIVLLLFTVGTTLLAMHNPGYVLIERAPYSMEMPLTLFVVLLVATVVLLYVLIHVTRRVLHIPRAISLWRLDRRIRLLQQALHEGLIKIVEGDYAAAEKELIGDRKPDTIPGVHYLAAAYAAQAQNQHERRDEYLGRAQQMRGLALATGLLQSRLYTMGREYERSLATLRALRVAHPGNRTVLQELAKQARGLKDWTAIADIIPELRRHKALDAAEIDALELEAHRELLTVALGAGPTWENAFRDLPKSLRRNPAIIALHARGFIEAGEMQRAESLLTPALERAPHEALFAAYGDLRSDDSLRVLSQAETWLAAAPDSPALLVALAKLAATAQLPGKAREYAERATHLEPTRETFAQLVGLMDQIGDTAKAAEYCRRGLKIGLRTRPAATR